MFVSLTNQTTIGTEQARLDTMVEEDDNSVSDSSQISNDKSSTSDRFSSSNDTNEHPQADERDEFREVRQMARDETRKVRFSRIAVTLLLLAVAVAVTVTTYVFLLANERGNFEAGVSEMFQSLCVQNWLC